MSASEVKAWDEGVQWEPIETWEIPVSKGRYAPTEEQRVRLGEGQMPTVIDGRTRVVGIRPEAAGGSWLVQAVNGDAVITLEQEDAVVIEGEPERWELQFGTAPIGWLETLSDFDGW